MSETIEVQEDGQIPIYTGIFLVHPVIDRDKNEALFALSPYHITFHYSPGDPMFPEDVGEGDWTQIVHRAVYDDGEILASRVYVMRPFIDNEQKHESFFTHQYDRRIKDENGEDAWREGYPLHITWDSNGLPPVVAAERLENLWRDSSDPNWKYYNKIESMANANHIVSQATLEAHELDKTNSNHLHAYHNRITPIFNMMHPMGIWKTFKSEPKEENLGV